MPWHGCDRTEDLVGYLIKAPVALFQAPKLLPTSDFSERRQKLDHYWVDHVTVATVLLADLATHSVLDLASVGALRG